jgi:NodT family efflux transporter outer membrane factor (OMF) lipoprotein
LIPQSLEGAALKQPVAFLRLWVALVAPLAVLGCAVGPKYHSPLVQLPSAFSSAYTIAPTTAPSTQSAMPSARPVDLSLWWESLGDPQLNSLVKRAIASNYDLRIAAARLQEARSFEFAVTGGVYGGTGSLPGVELSAGAGRGSGSNSTRGRVTAPINSATNTKGLSEITQVIGLDAGWELDLFGHYSHLVDASQADVEAVVEARNEVLVTLIADLVRTYADVRSYQYRLKVARQNLATQQRTLDLVRIRVKRQLSNELDVALAERQLSTTLSRIAPLEALLESAKRRVSVLVGRYPGELKAELDEPRLLPASPPLVNSGMPVQLLRRRPDIRRGERELAAATARIGVAIADLFPRVSVTAGAGIQGQGLGRDPEKDRYIYSIGPSLYWPFLDFGRLDSVVQAQDFRMQQILLSYQRSVIVAVQEVDDALNNYSATQYSLTQLGNAVTASKRAEALAQQRYDIGLTDFLNVLDAQRQLFDLQDQYAIAQTNVVRQFVALYKALGGGWEGYEAPAPPPPGRPALLAAIRIGSEKSAKAKDVGPAK